MTSHIFSNLSICATSQQLVESISRALPVQGIYQLGQIKAWQQPSSIFEDDLEPTTGTVHALLLVIADINNDVSTKMLENIVEDKCRAVQTVTAIVIAATQFNQWLHEAHPFAVQVVQKATCFTSCFSAKIAVPPQPLETHQQVISKEAWDNAATKVNEFVAGADVFIARKYYNFAAFMLHQAAEHTLATLFYLSTQLRVNTHNLDRLLRLCSFSVPAVHNVFPRTTETSMKLFRLLQTAYIESRYSTTYSIRYPEVCLLLQQVTRLKDILLKAGSQASRER